MGGTHCRHRRRQQVALLVQRGARLRLARARGKCAPIRFTPPLFPDLSVPPVARARASAPQFSAISIGPLAKDPVPRCARPATTPSSSASGPNARAPAFAPNRNRALGVVSLGPVYGWHPLSPSTAPAGRSAGATRRSAPPRTRAREMRANKVYAAPFFLIFQCRLLREREQAPPSSVRFRSGRWRKTPYLAALARRPHHHHRHPARTPELQRSPPIGIVPLG